MLTKSAYDSDFGVPSSVVMSAMEQTACCGKAQEEQSLSWAAVGWWVWQSYFVVIVVARATPTAENVSFG